MLTPINEAHFQASRGLAFVSYASEDRPQAQVICRLLEEAGQVVWFDNERLDSDTTETLAAERIWDALASATDVVVVLSSAAVRKPWIRHEWLTAAARWAASGAPRIHAVVLDQAAMPEIPFLSVTRYDLSQRLPSAIVETHAHDESARSDDEWESIARELRAEYLMGGPTAAKAVHRLNTLWSSLKQRIEAADRAHFAGADARAGTWLRMLGRLLDMRSERLWLHSKLTTASKANDVPLKDRAMLANNLGVFCIHEGNWQEAEGTLEHAIALCKDLDDHEGVVVGVGNLALLALERGDPDTAMREIVHARELLDQAKGVSVFGPYHEAIHTSGLLDNHEGCAWGLRKEYAKARLCFYRHLFLAESLEERRSIAVALGRLAWTDIMQGRSSTATLLALGRYEQLSVATLNARGFAYAASWRAQYYLARNDAVAASRFLGDEVKLRELLGERVELCRALAWTILTHSTSPELGRTAPTDAIFKLRNALAGVQLGPHDASLMQRALTSIAAVDRGHES